MKIEFKEEQRFTQWWLWVILIGIGILSVIEIYKYFSLEQKLGDNPMPVSGIIGYAVFVLGLMALFWLMRLKTEIDQNEIRMNFFPFVKKNIKWTDVKTAKIVNYGFVGGWGIRFGSKYGTVYNTRGNKGLAIELLNGEKFIIGTQKEKALNEVVVEKTSGQDQV